MCHLGAAQKRETSPFKDSDVCKQPLELQVLVAQRGPSRSAARSRTRAPDAPAEGRKRRGKL